MVILADRQTLLLERADVPGFWQSVTGSMEWGEAPEACARRELEEETGLQAIPAPSGCQREFEIMPVFAPRYAPGTRHNTEHEFLIRVDKPFVPTLAPREHCQYQWLSVADACARVASWTNREALEALL